LLLDNAVKVAKVSYSGLSGVLPWLLNLSGKSPTGSNAKTIKTILLIVLASVAYGAATRGQSAFQNLNFESANVVGYPPGSYPIPITAAMPGWTLTGPGINPVGYDVLSLGGAVVSICDSHLPLSGFMPLQGTFSALFFGGEYGPASIGQSGLVPGYSRSLQMDIAGDVADFRVSLGGQELHMIPLRSFPTYTVYGADITSFAGQVEALNLSALAPPPPQIPPILVFVDDIVFSPEIVPEPTAGVFALGGLLLGLRFVNRREQNLLLACRD
jgi:hypothetical protein